MKVKNSRVRHVTRRPEATRTGDGSRSTASLAARMHLELVPMKSIDDAVAALPPGASVSVTCSPVSGIAETRRLTEQLVAAGHDVTPHVAARLVTGPAEALELAAWTRSLGLSEVFVIAGDAPDAAGPYDGALGFLRDFVAAAPGVARIGITGYPDGHAFLDADLVNARLHAKQALLDDAGLDGWVSTQMCFDAVAIRRWIEHERAAGLHLPIRLGVPGVIDRTRLLKMGTRLGIGTSLRFLSKHAGTMARLVAPGGYDPAELLDDLAPDAERLGIDALHCFTFNAVEATVAWHQRVLADAHRATA